MRLSCEAPCVAVRAQETLAGANHCRGWLALAHEQLQHSWLRWHTHRAARLHSGARLGLCSTGFYFIGFSNQLLERTALPGTSPVGSTNFPSQLGNSPFSNNSFSGGGYGSGLGAQGYQAGFPNGNVPVNPGSGMGVPSASLPGTALPSTSPAGGINPAGGLALPGNLTVDALRPAVKALGAGEEWDQLLSVGEKLGMLERSRQAVPAAAPVYQTQSPNTANALQHAAAFAQPRDTIRIASFNLSGWSEARLERPGASEMLIQLISQFDVVALQDIRTKRDDLLPNLMIQMNRGGRAFDFIIGPRIGRGDTREQLAFVFDTDRVETDRFQLYTVADPEDMLAREPLVGWFRTKQVDSREAFTFSLVNVHIDPNLATNELNMLPGLVEAIVQDGRGEDDIILAGDFSAGGTRAPFFTSGLFRSAIEGVATNIQGNSLMDNIAMPVLGTSEYMGRSGQWTFYASTTWAWSKRPWSVSTCPFGRSSR